MKDIERATMLLACYNGLEDDCKQPLVNTFLEVGMKGYSDNERVCGFLLGGCILKLYTLDDLSLSFSTEIIDALRPLYIENPSIPNLLASARNSKNQLSMITAKRYFEVRYNAYIRNGHRIKAKRLAQMVECK